MTDQVKIRSVKEFWNDFIIDGLKKNRKEEDIHNALIDAFHEEMIGLMKFRLRVTDLKQAPNTKENRQKVENVARDIFKKWNALCNRCRQYGETRNLIDPEDLKWEEEDRDASEESDYNENDMGDDGYPMKDEE